LAEFDFPAVPPIFLEPETTSLRYDLSPHPRREGLAVLRVWIGDLPKTWSLALRPWPEGPLRRLALQVPDGQDEPFGAWTEGELALRSVDDADPRDRALRGMANGSLAFRAVDGLLAGEGSLRRIQDDLWLLQWHPA